MLCSLLLVDSSTFQQWRHTTQSQHAAVPSLQQAMAFTQGRTSELIW